MRTPGSLPAFSTNFGIDSTTSLARKSHMISPRAKAVDSHKANPLPRLGVKQHRARYSRPRIKKQYCLVMVKSTRVVSVRNSS